MQQTRQEWKDVTEIEENYNKKQQGHFAGSVKNGFTTVKSFSLQR